MSIDVLTDDTPFHDIDLSEVSRLQWRNTLLKGMVVLPFLYIPVFFGFASISALGEMPSFSALGLLFLGHLVVMADVVLLGLYTLVHLALNPRLTLVAKTWWALAMYFTGIAGLAYLVLEVFSETGYDSIAV